MQVIRWCLKVQKPDIVGTMNTMTTTDLKPGIVSHPEYGYALAFEGAHVMLIAGLLPCDPHDVTTINEDDAEFGDGWERVEIVKPGHVQVRGGDLDPQTLSEWSQYAVHSDCDSILVRTGRAFIHQQVEQGDTSSHTPGRYDPTGGDGFVRGARSRTL